MDKITRIHIAKIPYEIGIEAEKALRRYLDEIRAELDADIADEIMADIEVRITEILNDRNIKRNDVIATKDIEAIQEQLGSPEQFTDVEAKGKQKEQNSTEPKKLLRDLDGAMIGGVASGLAAYFAVDPLIVRLIFVFLTFVSGLGILLYILLWILVPSAKTNSDKLLMRGEPVTAAALQRYRNTAQQTIVNLKLKAMLIVICKIIRVVFTAFVALLVLALLSSLGFASAMLYTQPLHQLYTAYHLNYILFGLIWLLTMTVIGFMILTLMRLWRRHFPSLKVALIALISVFILTVAGIAVVTPFIANYYKDQYGGNKLAVAIPVHTDGTSITPTSLNVTADKNLALSYVTTSQPIHATYQAYPGMGQPKISIINQKGVITVQASQLSDVVPNCVLDWCQHAYLPVRVTLYGPVLQSYTVNNGAELDLNNLVQSSLTLTAQNNSNLYIGGSYSNNLTLDAQSNSSVIAADSTAQTATITVQDGSYVSSPASDTLIANLPGNCSQMSLELAQTPNTITLNGKSIASSEFSQNNCVSLDDTVPFNPIEIKQEHGHGKILRMPVYNNGN